MYEIYKFIKFTLTFPACIFTIHNTTTSVAHFIYIFLIKTKFIFAHVFWLLGNIKQPPLTPELSTACAGVDLRVQSHDGVFTRRKAENHETEREWCIYVSLSPSLFSALRRIKTLTWDCTLTLPTMTSHGAYKNTLMVHLYLSAWPVRTKNI